MVPVELLHLGLGPPADVAGARLLQVRPRELGEAALLVKARGELAGDGLDLDEAAGARGLDRLLVKSHGLEIAAFETRPLGRHQLRARREVLGTALAPQ